MGIPITLQRHLTEQQEQLRSDRRAWHERTVSVVQKEKECEAAVEQLERDAAELTVREEAVAQQTQDYHARLTGLEGREDEFLVFGRHPEVLDERGAEPERAAFGIPMRN